MREKEDRDLVGKRNAMYAGEIQTNIEGPFIKVVLMFSFVFK